jgi:sugar (pentulose or hexulose) kinase
VPGSTIIVLDVGKTHSKLSLWSQDGRCIDRVSYTNKPQCGSDYKQLDFLGVAKWLLETLPRFADQNVQAIIPIAHGAALVGIQDDRVTVPPMDYEQQIPEPVVQEYRVLRDSFAVSGSPALPGGLNMGTQLYWIERALNVNVGEVTFIPYAQYWAWVLSGELRSEVTSLGCHTDLWSPAMNIFSPTAQRLGWASRFAPMADAGEIAGTLRPSLAQQSGLSPTVRVHVGIHDSNAALAAARGYAEIADHEATVLSTGTWFVAMRSPQETVEFGTLAEMRDCLVNVDVNRQPVPSARFMGGREIERLIGVDGGQLDDPAGQAAQIAAVDSVVTAGAMVLPNFAPGTGPFPNGEGTWLNEPADPDQRRAAIALYAALVADTMLELIGSRATLLIEGRFSRSEVFVRTLTELRPETSVYTSATEVDVSFGALRLVYPSVKPSGNLQRVLPLAQNFSRYKAQWHQRIDEGKST